MTISSSERLREIGHGSMPIFRVDGAVAGKIFRRSRLWLFDCFDSYSVALQQRSVMHLNEVKHWGDTFS